LEICILEGKKSKDADSVCNRRRDLKVVNTFSSKIERMQTKVEIIGVQRAVSKGVEDDHRPPALMAVSGVAHPQGTEG
jgi:uncharacterized NAD-dependent epimerase/dehydratase family protein